MNTSDLSFARLFDAVEYLVDDHVGIIRHAAEIPRQAGSPSFFHFSAQASDTSAFVDQKNFAEAGGASADRRVAMAKAIGEAVERYCAAIYDKQQFPLESFDSAPFPCVPPDDFALYNDSQYSQPDFPYQPFSHQTDVRWSEASDLVSGKIYYVPAVMVYLPYSYDIKNGEAKIVQGISTGLACHCSSAEATISAICEVIERDAFTITWQAMLSMPPIREKTLSDRNRDLIHRFRRIGSSVKLINITMEHGVPTVLSILASPISESPAFVLAASSNLDPEIAICKCLEELAHTRRLAVQLKRRRTTAGSAENFDSQYNQKSHVALYTDHSSRALIDFIFASESWIDFGEIPNLAVGDPSRDLATLVQKIAGVGCKVLIADLTTPDVRDLGLAVVRAVIPGFHPLFMGHRIRALGGWRLWNVPQSLGYPGIAKETGDNPAPHPYP